VQAFCSPFTGLLGDRLNRAWLIGVGALIWGVMTAGIGASRNLSQAMGFAAANGVGLAILIPCAQSLLADYYHPSSRGLAFGVMYCISSLGRSPLPPPTPLDSPTQGPNDNCFLWAIVYPSLHQVLNFWHEWGTVVNIVSNPPPLPGTGPALPAKGGQTPVLCWDLSETL
jgi:MFS family permease